MDLATTLLPLLQVFADEMAKPTARTFAKLSNGWLLAPHRTIIGMVRTIGNDQHHVTFYRLFSNAKWSIDQVRWAVFDLITTGMNVGDVTLIAQIGLKVFGTGMHHDPLLSSRSYHLTCWAVLCVIIQSR